MHPIDNLLTLTKGVSVAPKYPLWVTVAGAPYPFDIGHFKRFRHPHILTDIGLTVQQLDEIYKVCAILNGGDHQVVLMGMERNV